MANSCDLMLFINHCGQFVKVGNEFEYYGDEVTSRYGFDKDRFEEVQKLGYTKGEKLYFRANNSRKYVHMHNDEGVMEMLSMMEPGKHYVQIYVDSGSTNESQGDDKQKGIADVQQAADDNVCEDSTDEEYIVEESSESDGLSLDEIESCELDALGQLSGEEYDKQKGIADVQQAADDNVCEDSTDEEYIVEESSESDGLSLDEIESCELDALGQLSGEELDQFIDNFHEDSTDEEYVPEEESSESDGLGGDELGTDDEEYFEARRKRAESKKVADEETENFTLSSEKGCGSTNESDFQSLREDHSDYADSAEEVCSDSSSSGGFSGDDDVSHRKKKRNMIMYDAKVDHKQFKFELGMRFPLMADEEGKENAPKEWEVVSLTASAYAAAPWTQRARPDPR
ncbi:dynein heavy chain-like protein PF11_0240 [Striga asiatica]|uniref:Dynein heavy chain-like protein PF11_0240 n=1 Tax=Striga asiatica TaxID=4170 RepID=A0A5A7QXG1_STRAF|nr:dynein heavy chain-like protein PF11_0240 [Striga asiatica]